jgi:hypothetical protein
LVKILLLWWGPGHHQCEIEKEMESCEAAVAELNRVLDALPGGLEQAPTRRASAIPFPEGHQRGIIIHLPNHYDDPWLDRKRAGID